MSSSFNFTWTLPVPSSTNILLRHTRFPLPLPAVFAPQTAFSLSVFHLSTPRTEWHGRRSLQCFFSNTHTYIWLWSFPLYPSYSWSRLFFSSAGRLSSPSLPFSMWLLFCIAFEIQISSSSLPLCFLRLHVKALTSVIVVSSVWYLYFFSQSVATDQFIASLPRGPGSTAVTTAIKLPSSPAGATAGALLEKKRSSETRRVRRSLSGVCLCFSSFFLLFFLTEAEYQTRGASRGFFIE